MTTAVYLGKEAGRDGHDEKGWRNHSKSGQRFLENQRGATCGRRRRVWLEKERKGI